MSHLQSFDDSFSLSTIIEGFVNPGRERSAVQAFDDIVAVARETTKHPLREFEAVAIGFFGEGISVSEDGDLIGTVQHLVILVGTTRQYAIRDINLDGAAFGNLFSPDIDVLATAFQAGIEIYEGSETRGRVEIDDTYVSLTDVIMRAGDDVMNIDASFERSGLTIRGGKGNDIVTFADTKGRDIVIDLRRGFAEYEDGQIFHLESIEGASAEGDGSKTLFGTNGANSLAGFEGTQDILWGRGGDDDLSGNGSDIAYGGKGDDRFLGRDSSVLRGQKGDDYFRAFSEFDGVINGGKGRDTVEIAGFLGTQLTPTIDLAKGRIDWAGNQGITLISVEDARGTDNRDVLLGSDGANRLEGFSGHDRLVGGSGRDILDGGSNGDVLIGGDGNDLFLFRNGRHTFEDDGGSKRNYTIGHDVIRDFEIGADTVQILGLENANRWEWLLKRFTQDGDDVILDVGRFASITFRNLMIEDLSAADFGL